MKRGMIVRAVGNCTSWSKGSIALVLRTRMVDLQGLMGIKRPIQTVDVFIEGKRCRAIFAKSFEVIW